MIIEIKGAIISDGEQWIYDLFGMPATSPSKVNKALSEAEGQDVDVIINSGGGSVFAGSEMYTSLKDYSGYTKGKIVGIAASAASVVSMGVRKLLMSPTAQMMIHNSSMLAGGNKNDLTKDAETLGNIDKSIANSYMLKTRLSQNELLELMNKETWLTAQDAKEKGFIDEIMFDDGIQFNNSITNGVLLPQEVINKIRNEKTIPSNIDKLNDLKKQTILSLSDKSPEFYNEIKRKKIRLQLDLI